jgi:type IV pilus biogenesis protein CpaD/CtpE
MSCKIVLAAAAMMLTGASETLDKQSGSTDPGFGEALKYDMAVQTINPDPVYDDKAAKPGDHGGRAADAVKRYRTDRVKEPRDISTTAVGGGSGPR